MNEETLKLVLKQIKDLKASSFTEKKLMELTKKEILQTSDVALLFNRSVQTIHRWRKRKIIYATDLNGSFYFRWEDIIEMLKPKTLK